MRRIHLYENVSLGMALIKIIFAASVIESCKTINLFYTVDSLAILVWKINQTFLRNKNQFASCVTLLRLWLIVPRMRTITVHSAIEGPTIRRKGSDRHFNQQRLHGFLRYNVNFGSGYLNV